MDSNISDFNDKISRLSINPAGPLKEKNNVRGDGDLNEDVQLRYNQLVTKAKQLAGQGEVRAALDLTKQAAAIHSSDKLLKRIAKMQEYLAEFGDENSGGDGSEEEEGDMLHVGDGFYLYKDLHNKLYAHQKQGILWMWALYRKKKGGILGDDMGLGKTIQVIAFLSGMFDADKVHAGLLIMPVSLIVNWEKEFEKWSPGIRVQQYHGTKRDRERALGKVQLRGGILLTSYGMVVTNKELLAQKDGREFVWDYIILDEGHKIKNPSMKTSKSIQALPARNRLILTGTPIQNNLKELWALFDWAHQGALLGTSRTFAMEYDNPICKARQRDATMGEKRLGQEMSESLKRIISPYFLRRTKAEVNKTKSVKGEIKEEQGRSHTPSMPSLTRKNDLITWTFLSETQQKIYRDFLETEAVKELLMTTKSPLTALMVLKKICDHPRLLSTRACAQLGLDGRELTEEEMESMESRDCAADKVHQISDHVLVNESGKLTFLVALLSNLQSEGHRCLVFSQSRKMLDIIQKVITNRGHKVMRLDGTIKHLYEREQIIQKFQTDASYSVFLLTTQVGGVGLTLTAADRVVIFDPSWNPATDAQAVDRAFRLGQTKNVVIYRLITCGTVEEKIYRRQIFKDSITRQTTGNNKNPYRYFTKQELYELFILDNPRFSGTQQQLAEMHADQRNSDTTLDHHIAFLHTLDIFGLSDHDLMFSKEVHLDEESDAEDAADEDLRLQQDNNYIQSRVHKAQELLSLESSQKLELEERISKYQRNFERDPQYNQKFNEFRMERKQTIPEPVVVRDDSDEEFVDAAADHSNGSSPVIIDDDQPSRNDKEPIVIDLDNESLTDAHEPPVIKQEPADDTKPRVKQESMDEDYRYGGVTPKKEVKENAITYDGEECMIKSEQTNAVRPHTESRLNQSGRDSRACEPGLDENSRACESGLDETLEELTLEDQAVQADFGSETEPSPVIKLKKAVNRIESDSEDENCHIQNEIMDVEDENGCAEKVKSEEKHEQKKDDLPRADRDGTDHERLISHQVVDVSRTNDSDEDKENTASSFVHSPSVKKTPNKKRTRRKSCAANMKVSPEKEMADQNLIVTEELVFSPEARHPMLFTKPVNSGSANRSHRHESNLLSHSSDKGIDDYSSFVKHATKSPYVANSTMLLDTNKSEESPEVSNRVGTFDLTLAVDTPEDQRPNKKRLSPQREEIDSVVHVNDSCENSPVKKKQHLNSSIQVLQDSDIDSDAEIIGDSFDSGSSHSSNKFPKLNFNKTMFSIDVQRKTNDANGIDYQKGDQSSIGASKDNRLLSDVDMKNDQADQISSDDELPDPFTRKNVIDGNLPTNDNEMKNTGSKHSPLPKSSLTMEDSPIHPAIRKCAQKEVVLSSDEENLPDPLNKYDKINQINSLAHNPGIRNSISKPSSLSDSLAAGDDSPIHAVTRKCTRKAVIESSDEEDLPDLSSNADRTDQRNSPEETSKTGRRKSMGRKSMSNASDPDEFLSAESGSESNHNNYDASEEEGGEVTEDEDAEDVGRHSDDEDAEALDEPDESMGSFIVSDDHESDEEEELEEEESEEEIDEQQKMYEDLVEKARDFYQARDLKRALRCILEALAIDGSDMDLQRHAFKIKLKIDKQKKAEGR